MKRRCKDKTTDIERRAKKQREKGTGRERPRAGARESDSQTQIERAAMKER